MAILWIFRGIAAYLVYNDAKARGLEFIKALFWGISSLLLPIVFVPLYLIIGRKQAVNKQGRYPNDDVIDIEATVIEDTINCPMCGNKVSEELVVCPHCRYTLKPKCQSCGKELQRDWKVCPHCQTATGIK